MTIEDAKVIVGGSLALLIIFLTVGAIYASGRLDVWALLQRYVAVRIGGIEPVDSGMEPVVPGLVLSHQEAEYTGTSIPVPELASRTDVLDILARAKVDGKYLFTGNKLADLFTGTAFAASRNVILAEIAAIREPEKPAVMHRPGAPLKRPVNGW